MTCESAAVCHACGHRQSAVGSPGMLVAATFSLGSVLAATVAVGIAVRDYAGPWSHASMGRPARATPDKRTKLRPIVGVTLGPTIRALHDYGEALPRRA